MWGFGKREGPTRCFSIQSVAGLDTPMMYVRGVGPKVAEMLIAKGIQTAEDLLYHLPFRYEDRQNPRSIDEIKAGKWPALLPRFAGRRCCARAGSALRADRGPGTACAEVPLVQRRLI